MSKLFLFAVGGTGARVLRSFTMMLAAEPKGFGSSLEVVPIIIDSDKGNGDLSRTIQLLNQYNDINRGLYPDAAQKVHSNTFFTTRLTPLNHVGATVTTQPATWLLEFGGASNSSKSISFADYIGLDSMAANANLSSSLELMNALYDDSPETSSNAELNLKLDVGFKGNPNIGTVIFNELKENPAFKKFLSNCNPANGDRVFIVGSIFGGTGSSGIPVIVDEIRRSQIGSVAQVPIGVALVLPYFNLQTKTDPLDTGAIDANLFNAKTIAALGAYSLGGNSSLNKRITNLFYIGDTYTDAYEYHEGRNSQKNAAHAVEWVAASAIVDFIQNNDAYGVNKVREYGVKTTDDETINLPHLTDVAKENLVDQISAFVIAMRYYREAVYGETHKVSAETAFYQKFNIAGNLKTGVLAKIDTFITDPNWGFYSWLKELEEHSHSLKLYNTSPSGSNNMKNVLAHKESKVSVGTNPTNFGTISGFVNNGAQKSPDKSLTSFVKCLRDASVKIYNNIKK